MKNPLIDYLITAVILTAIFLAFQSYYTESLEYYDAPVGPPKFENLG
jgi:hypothetical protein